jgi:hypothetical protein
MHIDTVFLEKSIMKNRAYEELVQLHVKIRPKIVHPMFCLI